MNNKTHRFLRALLAIVLAASLASVPFGPVYADDPVMLDSVRASGAYMIGGTLRIEYEPEDTEGLTYQWYNVDAEIFDGGASYQYGDPIPGATDRTFELNADYLGKYVGFQILKDGVMIDGDAHVGFGPLGYGVCEFETDGGSGIDPVTDIPYGGTVARPEDPVREGYSFDGWTYYDWQTDETVSWDFENDRVYDNWICLTAEWIPNAELPVSVSYDQTSYTVYEALEDQEYAVAPFGEDPDWSAAKTPTADSTTLTFEGLEPATSYNLYVRKIGSDLSPVPQPFLTPLYYVTTNGDCFVGSTMTLVTEPEDVSGLTYVWYRRYYWEDEETGESNYYDIEVYDVTGPTYTFTEEDLDAEMICSISKDGMELGEFNASFYSPVGYGTVIFEYNDGEYDEDDNYVCTPDKEIYGYVYGDTLASPANAELVDELPEDPVRENYIFGGWYEYIDTDYEKKCTFDDFIVDNSYRCLTAKWLAPSYLFVEAEQGFEYTVAPKGEEPDWSIARTPDEYETNLLFDGLLPGVEYVVYSRASGEGPVTAEDVVTPITEYGIDGDVLIGEYLMITAGADLADATYRWYRVTKVPDEENEDLYHYVKEPIEGATERTYRTTDDDADYYIGFEVLVNGTVVASTDDHGPITYGTVTFDSNGGTPVDDVTGLRYFDLIPEPDEPEREGYEFRGWYCDMYEMDWEFDNVLTDPWLELTARWSEIESPEVPEEPYEEPAAIPVTVEEDGSDTVETRLDELTLTAYEIGIVDADDTRLNIATANGTVKLDAETVDAIAETGANMTVLVRENEDGTTTFDVKVNGETIDAPVRVEFPAPGDGQILVIVAEDGTETVVAKSVVEDGTVYAEIPAGSTVKLVDRETGFDDVDDEEWYADAVAFNAGRELFEGTGEGNFDPEGKMTRAMMVTVLYRLEGAKASGTFSFDDVDPAEWYADAASWAGEAGIVEGTDGGFDPDLPVTREQIAVMLYRYAKYLGVDTSAAGDLNAFTDGADTSGWALEAFRWALGAGIFEGYGDGTLAPLGEATRAEAAAVLMRFIAYIVK